MAVRPWKSSYFDQNAIEIKKGDEGKIVDASRVDKGWVCVTVPRRGLGPGSCNVAAIKAGTVPYGQTRIQHDLPVDPPTLNLPSSGMDQSRFGNTLRLLLLAIKAKQDFLNFLPDWFLKMGNEELSRIAADIVRGTEAAEFLNLLNTPNFTVQALSQKGTQIRRSNSEAGVYHRTYSNFRNDASRKPDLYAGKTINMGSRAQGHESETKGKTKANTSKHYASARQAQRTDASPMCIGIDRENSRTLAEQAFILMLQTYHPQVLAFQPRIVAQTADTSTANSAEDFSRTYAPRATAFQLTQIAKVVFQKTGWPGAMDRPSFGAGEGLNWSSPLAEILNHNSPRTIWTKTVVPDEVAVFRRPATLADVVGKNTMSVLELRFKRADNLGGATGSHESHQNFMIDKGPGCPEKGDKVWIVVEIMINGQEHATPWARLPSSGPWTDWNEANRLAVRVEWEDSKGAMRMQYCQHRQSTLVDSDKSPASILQYARAMGMIRFFLQQLCTDPRDWYLDFGRARIKEITFDNLTQTYNVREISAITPIKRAELKERSVMARELTSKGLQNVDQAMFGYEGTSTPQASGRAVWKRYRCDYCHLQITHGFKSKAKCSQIEGTNNCTNCKSLFRPCSYTNTALLEGSKALQNVLLAPPMHSASLAAELVDDPKLVILTEET